MCVHFMCVHIAYPRAMALKRFQDMEDAPFGLDAMGHLDERVFIYFGLNESFYRIDGVLIDDVCDDGWIDMFEPGRGRW